MEIDRETIDAVRVLIIPPERQHDGRMFLHLLSILGIAILPLAVLPVSTWLFPAPAVLHAAAPAGKDLADLAERIRTETGTAPVFSFDLFRQQETADAARTSAKIAPGLAAQDVYPLRVRFLAALTVLVVLAVSILFAQVRIVRQHWDIILENTQFPKPPDLPSERQVRFRLSFGLLVAVFFVLVFGAASWAGQTAANPVLGLCLRIGLGLVAVALMLDAVRGGIGLFRQDAAGGWVLAGTVLAIAGMVDRLTGAGWVHAGATWLATVVQVEPAAVAAGLAALAGLGMLAVLDRGMRILREQALAPLAALALVLGGTIAAELLDSLRLPGQPALPDVLTAQGLSAPVILVTAAALAGVIVAATAVTLFGTLTFARNYPDADAAEAFAARYDILTRNQPEARKPDKVWTDMRFLVRTELAGSATATGAPVRLSLGPRDIQALIRALTVTLAVLMVVTLVVMSLGFDVLESGLTLADGAPAPLKLREAFGRSLDATVLLLGLGLSAALSTAYIWPMLRIAPHVAAEDAPADPRPGVAERLAMALADGVTYDPARGRLTLNMTDDIKSPTKTEADIVADARLARWIGADQAKFRIICNAWIYGAAFHSILDDSLAGKLRQVLTLLAPALAGTVLGLLG